MSKTLTRVGSQPLLLSLVVLLSLGLLGIPAAASAKKTNGKKASRSPETTITDGPSGTIASNSASFSFTSSKSGSSFRCRLNGSSWTGCSSPKGYSGLADASHLFEVRAIDSSGNVDRSPASRGFTVDTTPPETTITDGPSGTISSSSTSFSSDSSESGSSFRCRLDSSTWADCSSPEAYSGLADGSHLFEVRAVDAAGNSDQTPAGRSFSVSLSSEDPRPAPDGYTPASKLGPVPAGAHYLSPTGSDSNPGTADQPWQTIEKAVSTVNAGATVVLLPGTYGALDTTTTMSKAGTSSAPITFRGDPSGAMPRILGHFKITGGYQRFNYLLFDGPTGQVKPPTADNPNGEQVQVSIYGSSVNGVEISDSEIRDSRWHAGLYLSTANDVRITGNYIHDNGDPNDPGQANKSHGVYFSKGSGLLANNVIEDNVARGIQLYSSPHDVVMSNNTIVGNGKSGIQFATETADSIAVNNLVAYNGEYGIRGAYLTGTGNAARNNLVWGNPKGNLAFTEGISMSQNLQQNPGFGADDPYRPPATSPAVDHGTTSNAPAIDFDAAPRPSGAAPDVGAFETG